MKIQIIYLSQKDDVISIRDKMNWCQTSQIILVWPDEGPVVDRMLDLKLLKQHAAGIGAQLVLVTDDIEVRFYARQINIPVYKNLHSAQDTTWPATSPKKIKFHAQSNLVTLKTLRKTLQPKDRSWQENPITRLFCLALSVSAIFALVAFILPGAKIILSPQTQIQSMQIELTIDPAAPTLNMSTGSLPTYSRVVIVEGNDSIPTTSSMVIPDEYATGKLQFTNISKREIIIPSGTIVRTRGNQPIQFITVSEENLSVSPNKSVFVDAKAVKPGSSGNLLEKSLVIIDGGMEAGLKVTNPSVTQGGTDVTIPSPSVEDQKTLRDLLTIQLMQVAIIESQSFLPEGDLVIAPTMTLLEILSEEYTPSIGEPSEQIGLLLRIKLQTQVVSGLIIHNLAASILNANQPIGYSPLDDSLKITKINDPALGSDDIIHWTIVAERKLQADISSIQATGIVRGATIDQALARLSAALPVAEEPQILIYPTWWPRLPMLTMRIEFVQAIK